eukprot:TRINITY_DN4406_c0_g2_i1.p1 TRINITY_DN4406_c0_g2~~TRINITY_DN4406_c0_g2_i1.p1  ORF type:complete len:448 (-),score=63.81 TRINITY_DN4406_c0_g2_i1:260-1435(-)
MNVLNEYGNCLKNIMKGGFRSVTIEEILGETEADINTICTTLGLSTSNAKIALTHYNWNLDETISEYYIKSREVFFYDLEIEEEKSYADIVVLNEYTIDCPSCFELVDSNFIGLTCQHYYCRTCFEKYLNIAISDGITNIRCPSLNCKQIVDNVVIASIVPRNSYAKYLRFIAQKAVDTNNSLIWCRNEKCEAVISRDNFSLDMVMCNCGSIICFRCGEKGHWPVSCEIYSWFEKRDGMKMVNVKDDEIKSVQWLLDFTMPCPSCSFSIQKDGGCNHMSCKSCKYEFCWVCRSPWDSSCYVCKNEAVGLVLHEEQEFIANHIDYNLSHYQLYVIHKNSMKSDRKLKSILFKQLRQYIYEHGIQAIDDCHIICQALEHVFMVRNVVNITLNI